MIKEALEYLLDIGQRGQHPYVVKELSKPGVMNAVYIPGKGLVTMEDYSPQSVSVIDFDSLKTAFEHFTVMFDEPDVTNLLRIPMCFVSTELIRLDFNPSQQMAPVASMRVRYGDDYNSFCVHAGTHKSVADMARFLREELHGVSIDPDLREALQHVNFVHTDSTSVKSDRALQSLDKSLRDELLAGSQLPDEVTFTFEPLSPYPEIVCVVHIRCALHVNAERETVRYVPLAGQMHRAESVIRQALTDRFIALDTDIPVVQC